MAIYVSLKITSEIIFINANNQLLTLEEQLTNESSTLAYRRELITLLPNVLWVSKVFPFNSRYRMLLGKMYTQIAKQEIYYFLKADKEFKEAIRFQPTNYEIWLYYSLSGLYQLEMVPNNISKAELNNRIYRALTLGKYERVMQKILIPQVLNKWDILDKKTQHIAIISIKQALEYNHNNNKLILNGIITNNLTEEFKEYITIRWHKQYIKSNTR